MIESIELLTPETVMVICTTEKQAKQCLKRNPSCTVERGDDGERTALIYNLTQTNLINAIKRK